MADKFIASPVKRHYFKCIPLLGRQRERERERERERGRGREREPSSFDRTILPSLPLPLDRPSREGQYGLYRLLRFLNSSREHFGRRGATAARGRMPFVSRSAAAVPQRLDEMN
jgi:hypothetical protein